MNIDSQQHATPGKPATAMWVKQWNTVAHLRHGPLTLSEIFQFNQNWYTSGRTIADNAAVYVPLAGPVSHSRAVEVAEKFAEGYLKAQNGKPAEPLAGYGSTGVGTGR